MDDPGTWKEKKHRGKHLKEESALPQLVTQLLWLGFKVIHFPTGLPSAKWQNR